MSIDLREFVAVMPVLDDEVSAETDVRVVLAEKIIDGSQRDA